jgi:hypothetical protein
MESAQGVHYLSLVIDAYSRKIMGYELSDEMKPHLSLQMKTVKKYTKKA